MVHLHHSCITKEYGALLCVNGSISIVLLGQNSFKRKITLYTHSGVLIDN